jgi:small-conductance mechanosensitive channel
MVENFHLRHGWFGAVFVFCGGLVLTNLIHYIVFRLLKREGTGTEGWSASVRRHLARPARLIFLLTCFLLVLPFIPTLSEDLDSLLRRLIVMAIVVGLGWFAIGWVYVAQDMLLRRYDLKAENNIEARRVHTQFLLVRRMVIAFIVIIDIGVLLWTTNSPRIWNYGSGLLASAGLASLLLAAAAKSTVSNFLAGLQIALTGSVKLDDVILIEGEWARVEEINGSFVVMRNWDNRRFIVPLSFFVENTFQNWSRVSTDVINTAFLYVDYSVPVKKLRAEYMRLVQGSAWWDGKLCAMHVTNLTDRTMELRCAMSSRNSAENFELRCMVREEMTAWIQENYPEAFPTTRFRSLMSEASGSKAEVPGEYGGEHGSGAAAIKRN